MKTTLAWFAAAAFAGVALGQQLTPPSAATSEQKKLELWFGDWTYETVNQPSVFGPGGTSIGSFSALPVLGGTFVELRGEEQGAGGISRWLGTQSFDPVKRQFSWRNLASDGGINDGSFTIAGTKVTHAGTLSAGGKLYQIRGTYEFAADLGSYTENREISADGKTWKPFSSSRATKLKAALALPVPENVDQQLMDRERVWAKALVAADLSQLDGILAPEWMCTGDDGALQTKQEEFDALRKKDYVAKQFTLDDMKVRVYGDTAVVTGRTTEKSTYKGKDASGVYRWTDTWVKIDDGWQCVATHESKVAQP